MGEDLNVGVLTLKETAALLRVSEPTVRKKLLSGEIPGRQVGRQWRVRSDALDYYLRGGIACPSQDAQA